MKGINYKYINILLLLAIGYLLFLMRNIWLNALIKILNIIFPFIVSFAIAYVLYPFLKFLTKKNLPKWLSIMIIIITLSIIIGLTLYFAFPMFANQLVNLFSNLTKFTAEIAQKYGIDTNIINTYINRYSSKILEYVGTMLGNGTILNLLNTSVSYITNTIIIILVSIYFLNDMDDIRKKVKNYLLKINKKNYELVKTIDTEIYSYLKGLLIFMIIQFFEYTILFLLIGHPNFLLIGILACITTIIPYFGGLFTNILALLIASVVSKRLFILTLIITIIFPNIDGYVISPKIYGKTNQIPALVTIFAVFIGGAIFGFIGILIAVPLAIITMTIIRVYKSDIMFKLNKIKKIK